MVTASGLLTLATSSAHAATTIQVTCTEQSITIYGAVGDEFVFSGGGVCNNQWELYNVIDYYRTGVEGWLEFLSQTNMSQGGSVTPQSRWWQYFAASGPSSVTVRLMATNALASPLVVGDTIAEIDNDGAPGGLSIIIPIIYGGTSEAAAVDVTWTVVRQGLPMPGDGTCTSVADADYAWGTGLTGGWVTAWENWVDGGKGGWACIRALVNRGGNDWVIDNAA